MDLLWSEMVTDKFPSDDVIMSPHVVKTGSPGPGCVGQTCPTQLVPDPARIYLLDDLGCGVVVGESQIAVSFVSTKSEATMVLAYSPKRVPIQLSAMLYMDPRVSF